MVYTMCFSLCHLKVAGFLNRQELVMVSTIFNMFEEHSFLGFGSTSYRRYWRKVFAA